MSAPLQSSRTVFVLDVSYSMNGLKSEALQLSTKRYIEDISDNSYVGIVLFNNKSWIEHKVVKITDRQVRNSLLAKVPNKFGGYTNIGSGLLMGLSSLTQENLITQNANFILVTDGDDTTGTDYLQGVLPHLLNAKVKVICIALGNAADPNLERLAKETNGNVYIASDSNREMAIRVIESAFIESKVNNCKELNEALTISVCNDLIQINHLDTKKVVIDPDIGRNTNFTIGSENIDKFTVSMVSPNGQKFDITSKEFTKNESYKRYQLSLSNAESGVWSIVFNRHTADKLSVTVSVTSQPLNPNAIQMRVWTKEADPILQMPPLIFAEIRKGTETVINANVTATIDIPNGTQKELKLNNYNNIYYNYFTDYSDSGRYNVSVLAKNDSNCQLKSNESSSSLSGVQNVPQFERQLIVGCFKVTDCMPSAPSTQKLEELLLSESMKAISMSSNRLNNTVEAPAPRNAKAPIARVRTSIAKKNDQQLDEIKIAKDNLRDLLLVVKKLVTFSKLSDNDKVPHKKLVEEIDSFIYSTKSATISEVDAYRLKLEELKTLFSKK